MTVVVGVPLTVLPILDGMLFVSNGLEVARDIALINSIAVIPCLMLAVAAWAVQRALASRLGSGANAIAWSLTLVPLAFLMLRQSGRVALQWGLAVSPELFTLEPSTKLITLALCSATLGLLMFKHGWTASLARLLEWGEALRPICWSLLVGGALLLVWMPPDWKPMASAEPRASMAPPGRPNILVLTIDTVSGFDADACNPASETMPNLARFAQSATCFTRFQTASNFTTAATSTMETGLLPWAHRAAQPDASMVPKVRKHTLAMQLRNNGWRTHSITDNLLGSPRHHGSHEGYDTAWLSPTEQTVNAYRYGATRFAGTSLPRLVAASLAFLTPLDNWRLRYESPFRSEAVYADLHRLLTQERQVAPNHPQFIWTLSLPPHAPYLPPQSTRYKLLPPGELDRLDQLMQDNLRYPEAAQAMVDKHRLRYRESLMAADAALGDTLRQLERDGWLRNTIVVITTDHGESFEKGFLGHAGWMLHQPLVQGPLVIRLPGQTNARVVNQPVSQADLAPTLLDLAGVPPLPQAEGRSLRALLEGEALPDLPVFSMALEHQHRNLPLTKGQVAVVDGEWKLTLDVEHRTSELFHLLDDPGETRDLSRLHPDQSHRLRQLILQRIARLESRQ